MEVQPARDRRSAPRIDTVAAIAIAAHLVVRAVVSSQRYFFADDFWFMTGAEEMPFGAYLSQSYNGHLMPGQFVLAWTAQHLAPLNFGVVAAMMLILQLVASVLVWRLVRELVGPTNGALAGLVVFLFAPLSISAWVWYAAALQMVTLQLALAGAALHHVRFLRHGNARAAVWACVWYLVALAFWEKGLVTLLVLAALTALWFPLGPGVRGALRRFVHDRRLWAAYLAMTVVYLLVYVALTDDRTTGPVALATVGRVLWNALTGGAVPYLVGGPFGQATDSLTSLAGVSFGALYLALFLVVVGWTVWRRAAAIRAWVLWLGYLFATVVTVASSRAEIFGPAIGNSARYFADLAAISAVVLALAVDPVLPANSGEVDSDAAPPDVPRAAPAVVLVGVLYIGCCFATSVHVGSGVPAAELRDLVATARSDLRRLGEVTVSDQYVGATILPFGTARQLLVPMRLPVTFDIPSESLYVLAADGHLERVGPAPIRTTGPSPGRECAASVRPGAPGTVRLTQPLRPWRWAVRVDYESTGDAAVAITIGGTRQDAPIRTGAHSLFVIATTAVDDIRVGIVGGSARLCIGRAVVGPLRPLPPADP